MKNSCIIFILFISFVCKAQLFNTDHLVDADIGFIGNGNLRSGDFNGDGAPDLMTITSQKLVWYENLDGQGNFGNAIEIDNSMGQSFNQTVVDLNQDGWEDILISYFDQDFIAYYRNLGNGTFAEFQTLASNINKVAGIAPGDVDRDGDLDLVFGVSNNSGLYWIEHLDGNGSFGPLQPISTTISQARNQVLEDIDGDGDLDILSNSAGLIIMSWFENVDGQGDFSIQHIIDNSGEFYENSFQLVDLDGDGDLDNLSAKVNEVLWRENLDGLGDYGPKQVIFFDTNTIPGLKNVVATDLDNDLDLDITYDTGFDFSGKAYHINTNGLGSFGTPNYIPSPIGTGSFLNLAVDIDSDGDMDLTCGNFDNTTDITYLYWYENLTILGIEDINSLGIKIYPNPAKEVLRIESPIPLKKVSIYSVLGNTLKEVTTNFQEIATAKLPTGLLLVEIETEKGTVVEKIIKQ
tara:strand:+ start:6300 stop:7688 length:1389 start_codon:yes stop_codon:yes gene_type:complete